MRQSYVAMAPKRLGRQVSEAWAPRREFPLD